MAQKPRGSGEHGVDAAAATEPEYKGRRQTTTPPEAPPSLISNVLGSSAAGIVSRICTHPLDTIKARLQSPQNAGGATFKGPVDAMTQTMRAEGIAGFYRGFGAVIVGGTPGTMIYLCSYDLIKERMALEWKQRRTAASAADPDTPNFLVHFCSGLLAETIACIIYVPVDVIKERLQVQQKHPRHNFQTYREEATANREPTVNRSGLPKNASSAQASPMPRVAQSEHLYKYEGGWDALQKIMKTEGLGGLYKGYGATLASFGPFAALHFVFYEHAKESFRQHSQLASQKDLPFASILLSSTFSGAAASWLTSPLDMAKLRLQVQRAQPQSSRDTASTGAALHSKSAYQYRGFIDCLWKTHAEYGMKGLFRGAGARVLHVAPATTVMMTCFETCRKFFDERL